MTTILEATKVKDLGIDKATEKQIKTFGKEGWGANSIAYDTGVSRRRVMRALEILGIREYSEGSYA